MLNNVSRIASSCFLAAAILLSGCGGGGGGGASSTPVPGADNTPVTLSNGSASPGTYVNVLHKSITPGSTVEVTFTGANGYSVTTQSADTATGIASVAVPVLIDPTNGVVKEGDVTVSLASAPGNAPLRINNLPSLQGVAPGDVLIATLQLAVDNYRDAIDNLNAIANSENNDNSAAVATLDARIDDLEELIEEIQVFGELSVEMPDGSFTLLEGDQLELVDRILASTAAGIVLHLNTQPSFSTNAVAALQSSTDLPPILENPLETIAQMAQDFKNKAVPGTRALGGFAGAIVGVTGLWIGGTAGTVLAVIGGTGVIVLVAGTGVVTSVASNTYSSALRNLDTGLWVNSREAIEIIKKAGQDLVLTVSPLVLPRRAGDAVSVYSAGSGVQEYINSTAEASCNSNAPNSFHIAGKQSSATFCEVVLGAPTPPTDPGNGSGSFTINTIINLSGENIQNPTANQIDSADISISGTPQQLSISWKLTGASVMFVLRAGEVTPAYGIVGEEIQNTSGGFNTLRTFNPPLAYGNYNVAGTEILDSAQFPSPQLEPGGFYAITVGNEAGDQVVIGFTVN